VEEAARLGKRILPVICQPLGGVIPPPRLRDLNYIFFYADSKAPGAGFGTGLAKLIAALNTDFDWLREHTRYLQRATEWDRGGRPANRLLSGDDIAEAKTWAAQRPKNAPEPTALHLDLIRASEEEAEARSSAQRKQLEAMAAAQAERETALKKAEEAQRKRARIRNIAFVVVSSLAVLAGLLFLRGLQEFNTANSLLIRSQNIFRKLMDHMDSDTKKEVFAVIQTGADHEDATSMINLGFLYEHGFGVAQDYAKAREWYEKAAAKGAASAKEALETLPIREAVAARRYAEALQRQEAFAAKVEAEETKREGKPGEKTAAEVYNVAWYALFAREFTKALIFADRAHALRPDDLGAEINGAHALMFLERRGESKAPYLAHKGKSIQGWGADGKLWERVIAQDFTEFRKADVTHPMMADIEKELGISP
jgi:hypothetical protein